MGYKVNRVRARIELWWWAVVLCATAIEADYNCLCSYQKEAEILAQPTNTSKVDGYMYESDCRAYYVMPGVDEAYAVVGNENKYGYIRRTTDTPIQTCLDPIPQAQLVTITPVHTTVPATTTITTKPMPTTSPASTTTTTATTTQPTVPSTQTNHSTSPHARSTTIATTTHRPTIITTTTMIPTTVTSTKTTPTSSSATSTITSQASAITTPMPTTTTRPTQLPTTTTVPSTITTTSTTTKTTTFTPLTTTLLQTTQLSKQAYCTSLLRTSNTRYVTLHGTFCYEYVNKDVSWENARNDCRHRSGNLLEISSETTNDFIVNFIGKIGQIQPIWTGLHDRSNENDWMWDTGTSLIKTRYTNWMPSRYIDQYHVTEDCCVLVWNRGGQWDDVDCDGTSYNEFTSKAYICQFKIPGTP